MGLRVEHLNAGAIRARLEALGIELSGKGPQVQVGLKRAGMLALSLQERDFTTLSRGGAVRGVKWPRVGFTTALLRRLGSGSKMTTESDVEARRSQLPILADTGLLRMSFSPGRQGNVFRLSAASVEVGTAARQAALHQRGGETTFRYSAEVEQRLEQNVRKILPGRKPKRTAGGAKSRATRNWNAEFFILRAKLRTMHGRSYPVPARPMIIPPTAAMLHEWGDVIVKAVTE